MRPLYGNIDEAQTLKEALAQNTHLTRMLDSCEKECEELRDLIAVRDQELYESIEDTYRANKRAEVAEKQLPF